MSLHSLVQVQLFIFYLGPIKKGLIVSNSLLLGFPALKHMSRLRALHAQYNTLIFFLCRNLQFFERSSYKSLCYIMSVGCPQVPYDIMPPPPTCIYTNHMPMHMNQSAVCVASSMNHRELTPQWVWIRSSCNAAGSLTHLTVSVPPQRTCSFGGFDLTNRSLHVVNMGSEANVSAGSL